MKELARAFSLTSATLDLSASPNVTLGLLRLAQVPLGPALTSHYASIAELLAGRLPVEVYIKLLSGMLGAHEWSIRDYAHTALERLSEQYPDFVWVAIAPLLDSDDPEVWSRARRLLNYLIDREPGVVWDTIAPLLDDPEVCDWAVKWANYVIRRELAKLRAELEDLEEQRRRLSQAVVAGKVDVQLWGEAGEDIDQAKEDLEAAKKDCHGTGHEIRRLNRLDRSDRYMERERKLK